MVLCPTAIAEEEQSTRVGPTDNFEQSKEKNYPPTSLVTSALYLFVCWEGLTLALCAHRVDAGERVGAQGMETPRYSSCVLIGLSSPRGSVAQRFSPLEP